MKMVESTDIIAGILENAGIRHVVVSSGSRSLRMVRAVTDNLSFDIHMIIDERVAAFFALGICESTGQPAAIICTSGSAMLNYGPAVAEAYYRGIPLIVVTADRQKDMIDINDGQTIHQSGALANIVKHSVDIDATKPCSKDDFDDIAGCVSLALSPRKGPVHINLHLEEGNDAMTFQSIEYDCRQITGSGYPAETELHSLPFDDISGKRLLFFLGQMQPDDEFDRYVEKLSERPNVVVIADIVSNCRAKGIITDVESVIGKVKEDTATFAPDIVITLGKTAPVSRRFKEWLRDIDGYQHWRVNDKAEEEDTYFHLCRTIVTDEKTFLKQIMLNIKPSGGHVSYRTSWLELFEKCQPLKRGLIACAPWSDIYAIGKIMECIPEHYVIQSSNGLTIRYLAMTGAGNHLLFCNRGVNGIDGSTSTAIGYAAVSNLPTLLISGDMSAIYDISALFSGHIPPQFRMIIMANGGGEIFRYIKATRYYGLREEMLCNVPMVGWENVARAVGLDYLEANDAMQLHRALKSFFSDTGRAVIMTIKTPAGNSEIYEGIINEINSVL